MQHATSSSGLGQHRRDVRRASLFSRALLLDALKRSFVMLDPRVMYRNPVMLVTEIGVVVTTIATMRAFIAGNPDGSFFLAVTIWLWLTVLFANFSEALAEARGQAQADSLRAVRKSTVAHRIDATGRESDIESDSLQPGDHVIVRAGELVPADGEIIAGAASVNEAAITGESAPVIREAGGDRSGVTGGTTVLSDQITVRVTSAHGESFLDRMIALVESAKRQRTPNEIALTIVLVAFTAAFLIVTFMLYPLASYFGIALDVTTLVALLVCLIPTTIGGLLPAIGIAGMDRALAANLVAKSGKAVELAGDVDTLLLDKTGTITLGNRQARRFLPIGGIAPADLVAAAVQASLGDTTPEGRSIVEVGCEQLQAGVPELSPSAVVIPFSAETRMSGLDDQVCGEIRKGAPDTMARWATSRGHKIPDDYDSTVRKVAQGGGTPIVVADRRGLLGVVALEDVLKPGIRDRFERLRAMGLRTVMVTGDNVLTARAIAEQAGVDDFLSEATPEMKLDYIRRAQAAGRLVAMMGDGTNDAPALAQADLGVAMNAGTQAAKEAANAVDLDSDPTKLIEIVEIGKQLLMTRGALTTFSMANDVAKYFAIVPAIFLAALPQLAALNIMGLATPHSAILSAVIFNAIIIPLLIPIALKGVPYRPVGADRLLARNLWIYGLGGVIAPFIGIKLIDMLLAACGLV